MSIPYVIELMIFVILFAFVFDLLFVCYRDYIASQTLNTITRQIGIQGGVTSENAPVGYPDDNGRNYSNSSEMVNLINDRFEDVGINSWELQVIGKNYNINSNSKDNERAYTLRNNSNIRIDYQDEIEVVLTYSQSWPSLGKVFNIPDAHRSFSQLTTSEFKYNYDEWEGEN